MASAVPMGAVFGDGSEVGHFAGHVVVAGMKVGNCGEGLTGPGRDLFAIFGNVSAVQIRLAHCLQLLLVGALPADFPPVLCVGGSGGAVGVGAWLMPTVQDSVVSFGVHAGLRLLFVR